ncbi:TPA: hypothetical protein JLP35_000439 [Escherichia coli]|nr:hypothetical protein [Escherichia coli]
MMLNKLLTCAVLVLWLPFVYAQQKNTIQYEIVSAQIKPYISNSFGNGYMGLKQPPKEPGYGIFYIIKIPLEGEEAVEFINDGYISKKLICENIAIKPLLKNLYTVSTKYVDKNGNVISNLLSNNLSCG